MAGDSTGLYEEWIGDPKTKNPKKIVGMVLFLGSLLWGPHWFLKPAAGQEPPKPRSAPRRAHQRRSAGVQLPDITFRRTGLGLKHPSNGRQKRTVQAKQG